MSKIIKSSMVVKNEDEKNKLKYEKNIKDFKNIPDEYMSEYGKKLINEVENKADVIISKSELEAKKILGNAEKEKKRLIEEAKIKAEEIYETAKEKGFNEGFQEGKVLGQEDGYKKGEVEAKKIISEALELKKVYKEKQARIIKELEPKILKMIETIYEKIIGEKVEENNFILTLINNGISKLDPTDNLTIIVSKDDYDVVRENKELILAQGSFINNLNIKFDINFNKGDCIFEMDKGNIDLSVKDQLEEVKKTIYKILNNE